MQRLTTRALTILFILVGATPGCCKKGVVDDQEDCKLGAVDVCSKGCDAGKLENCMMLGRSYQMGEPKTERTKAMAIFLKACDAGHGPACMALALMTENGHYKDTHKPGTARVLLQKACDGGVEDACVAKIVRDFSTAADKENAFKQFEERCNKGKTRSCSELAWMYRSGHHVPEDKAKAVKIWQDGCAKSDQESCRQLALSYNNGWGIAEDKAKAQELWTKACDEGIAEACTDQASSLTRSDTCPKVDLKKSFELEQKACALFSQLGCALFAQNYETGKEGVVEKDLNLALKHYMQACTLGFESSCDDATKVMAEAAAN